MSEIYKVTAPNARELFVKWLAERGGVVVWRTQDLGNLDRGDMYTPATTAEGKEGTKPHWAYAALETITDINRFKFAKLVECGRCKIALNKKPRGYETPFGFFPTAIELTTGSTNRVHKMQSRLEAEHKTDVYYHFEDLEAVFEKAEWEIHDGNVPSVQQAT